MNEQARAWVYLIAVVVLIGLLIAGIVTKDDATLYIGMIGTAIGVGATGLAAKNTSIKPPPYKGPSDD